MPDHELSDHVRSTAKRRLEALELWLRRLIDQNLSASFGPNYLNHCDENGNRLIATRIVGPLEDRIAQEPSRYPRRIDAVLLDDAIAIICNPRLYDYFRDAMSIAFPDGHAEARTFLSRLVTPRNKLAHSNPLSSHETERVFCYCSDVIDSISEFYRSNNMNQDYNVPLILRVTDSFGTTHHRDQMKIVHDGGIGVFRHDNSNFDLRPGDTLSIELEIDPNFDEDSYSLTWASPNGFNNAIPNGRRVDIQITNKQVAGQFTVQCTLKTTKDWHRMSGNRDDFLMLTYRVLPPIDE